MHACIYFLKFKNFNYMGILEYFVSIITNLLCDLDVLQNAVIIANIINLTLCSLCL